MKSQNRGNQKTAGRAEKKFLTIYQVYTKEFIVFGYLIFISIDFHDILFLIFLLTLKGISAAGAS